MLLSNIKTVKNKSHLTKTKSLSKIQIVKLKANDDVVLMNDSSSIYDGDGLINNSKLNGLYLKNVPVKPGHWSIVNTGMAFNVNDQAVLLFVIDQSHSQDNNNGIYVQEVAIDGKNKGLLNIYCFCPHYYTGPNNISIKLAANLYISGKSVNIPSVNISESSINLKKYEKTGSSDDYANIWNINKPKEDNILWDFSKYPYLDKNKTIKAEIANNSSFIFLARKRNYRDAVSMGGIVIDDSGKLKMSMTPKNMIGKNTCAFQAFCKIPAKIWLVDSFSKPLPPSAGLNGDIYDDVDYSDVKWVFCKIHKAKNNLLYQKQYLSKPELQEKSDMYIQNLTYLMDKVNWNKYSYNEENFQIACDIVQATGDREIIDEDIGVCFEKCKSTSEMLADYYERIKSWLEKIKNKDNNSLLIENLDSGNGDIENLIITKSNGIEEGTNVGDNDEEIEEVEKEDDDEEERPDEKLLETGDQKISSQMMDTEVINDSFNGKEMVEELELEVENVDEVEVEEEVVVEEELVEEEIEEIEEDEGEEEEVMETNDSSDSKEMVEDAEEKEVEAETLDESNLSLQSLFRHYFVSNVETIEPEIIHNDSSDGKKMVEEDLNNVEMREQEYDDSSDVKEIVEDEELVQPEVVNVDENSKQLQPNIQDESKSRFGRWHVRTFTTPRTVQHIGGQKPKDVNQSETMEEKLSSQGNNKILLTMGNPEDYSYFIDDVKVSKKQFTEHVAEVEEKERLSSVTETGDPMAHIRKLNDLNELEDNNQAQSIDEVLSSQEVDNVKAKIDTTDPPQSNVQDELQAEIIEDDDNIDITNHNNNNNNMSLNLQFDERNIIDDMNKELNNSMDINSFRPKVDEFGPKPSKIIKN